MQKIISFTIEIIGLPCLLLYSLRSQGNGTSLDVYQHMGE